MGQELHRVWHFRHRQHRPAVERRADVVAVALHLPGDREELGNRERIAEQAVGCNQSRHQGGGRGPEATRHRDIGAHHQGKPGQRPTDLICQALHGGQRQVLAAIEERGLGAFQGDFPGRPFGVDDGLVPEAERQPERIEARAKVCRGGRRSNREAHRTVPAPARRVLRLPAADGSRLCAAHR